MSERLKRFLEEGTYSAESYSDGETKLPLYDGTDAKVEEHVAEVVEAEIEQDEIVKDSEALREGQTAMEAYYDAMEASLEDGGLNRHAAAMMQLGIERYTAELGLTDDSLPAMEAFGGTHSMRYSTETSMEAVGDYIKKAWEVTKKVLEAIKKAVLDFISKARNATGKLSEKAGKLKSLARSGKDYDGDEKIPYKSPRKFFADGKYVGDEVNRLLDVTVYVYNVYPNQAHSYIDKVAGMVAKLDPSSEDFKAEANVLTAVEGVFGKFPGKASPVKEPRFGNASVIKRSDVLPGNMALYAVHPKFGNDEIQDLKLLQSNLDMGLFPATGAQAAPDSVEITPLKMAKIQEVADKVERTCGVIQQQDADRVKAGIDNLLKAGEAFKAKADKLEDIDADTRNRIGAIMRGVSSLQKLFGTNVNGVTSYLVQEMNAMLNLCERSYSLANGGKQAESKDDDK